MISTIERNARLRHYLAEAEAGDQEAFARFYDETSPLAYGLALKLLHHAADAEDAALEAYVQVWRTLAQFDPERGSALTWLLMIVRARSVDRLRARRPGVFDPDALAALAAPADGSPARRVEELERTQILRKAMMQLPAGIRRLVELAYFGGLSHSEIAAGTGEPLGTVKTRIRRGLTILRAALAESPVAIAIP